MKNLLFLSFALIMFSSCSKNNDPTFGSMVGFSLTFSDKDGIDLLKKGLEFEKITSFGENNGQKPPSSHGFYPDTQSSDTSFLVDYKGRRRMSVLFDAKYSESYLEIKWKGVDKPDTLMSNVYYNASNHAVISRDLYFNRKKVWSEGSKIDRDMVEIIK